MEAGPPGLGVRAFVLLVAVAVFAIIAVTAGCASAPEVPLGPDGQPDPVLEAGRAVYGQRCATCHGASGQGGRGPKLADGAAEAAYPDIDSMLVVIESGKGSGMPAFGDTLDADQREAVARYIREVL